MRCVLIVLALSLPSCSFIPQATDWIKVSPVQSPPPRWKIQIENSIKEIDSKFADGQLGVLVSEIATGEEYGIHHDRPWYYASTTKVPVAVEVLNQIEQKKIGFETEISIQPKHRRDGSGEVSHLKTGSRVSVRYLLDQMLIESDNAATDILIGLVGIQNINRTLNSISEGFGPVTTLLDVRRHAYKEIHPRGMNLGAKDFIEIKLAGSYANRLKKFSKLIGVGRSQFRYKTLQEGFEKYYLSGYNSGTLDAFNTLLVSAARNQLISPFVSAELIRIMSRCNTGKGRIKAKLPSTIQFAHKTGTQVGRLCDFGLMTLPSQKKFTVLACAEKWSSMKAAEDALADIGAAVASATDYL